MGRFRSRPAPVSMFLRGRSVRTPDVVAVELHEDQVPDLDEAIVAPVLGTAVATEGCTLVEEDLRVRSAGAGLAHGPEVVLVAHALHALGSNANLVDPDLLGLVVTVVDRDPEAVTVVAQHLGEQLPSQRDGRGLEVVPEAEVAQHLEEGVVIGVGPDDLDVRGAEALLNGGGPGPGRLLLAQEVRLERDHARDGEEHRGVVRDQAGRRHDGVIPVGKEAREGRPQSVGVHRSSLPGPKTAPEPDHVEDMPTMGAFRCRDPVEP